MRWRALAGLVTAGAVLSPASVQASGHGPVFGLTTPTNAEDGWSLDLGMMLRKGATDDGAMVRGMITYGITEDLQVSGSFPLVLTSAGLVPARVTGMMAGNGDIEGLLAWRFHRRGTAVGRRVESTAYVGLVAPGPQRPDGPFGDLRRAAGLYTAVASGIASRSHYVWGGIGYARFAASGGDRRSDLLVYSAVWGFRPPAWRTDYPSWDWRVFAESTGERTGPARRGGLELLGTGGHQVSLAPRSSASTRTTPSKEASRFLCTGTWDFSITGRRSGPR